MAPVGVALVAAGWHTGHGVPTAVVLLCVFALHAAPVHSAQRRAGRARSKMRPKVAHAVGARAARQHGLPQDHLARAQIRHAAGSERAAVCQTRGGVRVECSTWRQVPVPCGD